MENTTQQIATCPVCHQPVLPGAYFCSNCGKQLNEPPLSTTVQTQIGMYLLSIILPSICYLGIGHWKGVKYFKSKDKKAGTIGTIAIALLVVSTIVTFTLAYVWTTEAIQKATESLNQQLGAF